MLIHVVVVIHQIQLIYSASLCAFRRRHANNLIEAAQNDKEKKSARQLWERMRSREIGNAEKERNERVDNE